MSDTSYGKKGGVGPTRGKVAVKYRVTLPSGGECIKRIYRDVGATAIATGFMLEGTPRIVVWEGEPAWEGDFGRLTAQRMERSDA